MVHELRVVELVLVCLLLLHVLIELLLGLLVLLFGLLHGLLQLLLVQLLLQLGLIVVVIGGEAAAGNTRRRLGEMAKSARRTDPDPGMIPAVWGCAASFRARTASTATPASPSSDRRRRPPARVGRGVLVVILQICAAP